LRSKKPNLLGIVLFPLKIVALWLVRLLQVMFLWLDKFDKEKTDPFGWACEAKK
jgi:hypothetical protein